MASPPVEVAVSPPAGKVTKLATDMVSVVDNLQRALAATPSDQQTGSDAALFEGVKLTEQSLVSTLERYGIRRIDALGAIFDPNLHEALMAVPLEQPVDVVTVSQVMQQGYQLKGRVIRPARVAVANP